MRKSLRIVLMVALSAALVGVGFSWPALAQDGDEGLERVVQEIKKEHSEYHADMDKLMTEFQDNPELLKAVGRQHEILHDNMRKQLDLMYLGVGR